MRETSVINLGKNKAEEGAGKAKVKG